LAANISPGQYCYNGGFGPLYNSGVPSAGSNEVQTLTLDATGGAFRLAYEGRTSISIPWNATNATLLASINAALDALFGTSWVVATAGTLTAGVGTVLLTFSGGDLAKNTPSLLTVTQNTLTGTGTATIARTTPGVAATAKNTAKGAILVNTATGIVYVNTGTQGTPTWTVVGSQS
jgi:hypothetical protein